MNKGQSLSIKSSFVFVVFMSLPTSFANTTRKSANNNKEVGQNIYFSSSSSQISQIVHNIFELYTDISKTTLFIFIQNLLKVIHNI